MRKYLLAATVVAAPVASSSQVVTSPTQAPTSSAQAATSATISTASSAEITPGHGSLTDCHGNTWTITASGSIMKGASYTPGGGGTAALSIAGCAVFGQDNGHNGNTVNSGGWFTLASNGQDWSTSNAPTAASTVPASIALAAPVLTATAPALAMTTVSGAPAAPLPSATPGSSCTPVGRTSGGFHVAGGQIIGPNGQPFIARGVNVYDFEADGAADAMISVFTGLNFVRVNIHSYDNPSTYQGFVDTMSARGTVVEFEDHPDAGGGQDAPYTGSRLSAESAWYAAMARFYASNPYVWFGTFNEPMATSGLSQWQQATYQAIRGAGNNSPILLEVSGSRADNLQQALVPSIYANMTNTIWDVHIYGYQVNYSTDQATVDANVAAMAAAAQTIPSADGTMPVLLGEYGPSTDGTSDDPNGVQNVTAVVNAGGTGKYGSAAWAWNPGGSADHLLDGSGQPSSPYGQMVRIYINTTVVPLTPCQAAQSAQAATAAIQQQMTQDPSTPAVVAPTAANATQAAANATITTQAQAIAHQAEQ